MDLRQMLQFVAVAELRSFRRAAERLHMAQPPLSQASRRLARELGAALFKRTSRSVELTEAGNAFLPEARKVIAGAEAAVVAARQAADGHSGRVRIGFTTPWAYDVVLDAVTGFRTRFPGVTLNLREETSSTQVQLLLEGALDVGFVRLPHGHVLSDLATLPLLHDTLCIALPRSHPLAGHRRLPLKRLQPESFVIPPPSSARRAEEISLRAQIAGLCAEAGFVPRIAQEARRMETIVRLVGAGLGVALVPSWTSRRQWSPHVRYVNLQAPSALARLTLAAVWPASSTAPAIGHFTATVRLLARR
jgi:DNA-binding transcriptional LysR family regulator